MTTAHRAELDRGFIREPLAPQPRSAPGRAALRRVEPRAAEHPRERVESLDALRGLMALAVVVYHLGAWTRVFSGALRDVVIVAGVYSVQGFFIISGLCFFHLYASRALQPAELPRFYAKRFLRLAPLYYLAITLSLALEPIYQAVFSWGRLLENLTLGFGLFHPNHAFVVGGWSIGLEVVFYLALPALLWLARRRWTLYALALALLACSLPYAFGKVQAASEAQRFHVYVELPNHAFLFVLGAISADLRTRWSGRLPLVLAAAVAVALGALALSRQATVNDHFEVMVGGARYGYLALCWALVLLFAFARWPRGAWLRPLRWLGDRSYALYLMHPVAWLLLRDQLPAGLAPQLQAAAALLAAFTLAELAHRALERPALRYQRSL